MAQMRSDVNTNEKNVRDRLKVSLIIVRAGAVEWGGGNPPPFVSAEREALVAQQRCRDG